MKLNRTAWGWPVRALLVMALVGVALYAGIQSAAPVAADTAKFYLDCPNTKVQEGQSVDVYLVRVTNHQHQVRFGAHFHTDAGTAGTSDYVHQNTGAIWSNSDQTRANRMRHTVHTRQDDLAEGDETFVIRFTPVNNVVDRNNPDRDEKCELTIRHDDPNVTNLQMVSKPAKGDTYGVGEQIEFAATFNTPVQVTGGVLMGFYIGDRWDGAWYRRGSGTNTLVFGYEVKPQDRDTDGIHVHNGYIDNNGRQHGFGGDGSITADDSSGARASAWYTGINSQPGHKVNGSLTPQVTDMKVVSTPAKEGMYGTGEDLLVDVTFSAAVRVTDPESEEPYLITWWRESSAAKGTGKALYESGSGTKTLRFAYTVRPGDYDGYGYGFFVGHPELAREIAGGYNGVIGPTSMGAGSIKTVNHDVNANHSYDGVASGFGHRLGGQARIEDISITSTPANGKVYREGEKIEFKMKFNYPVLVAGTPELLLEVENENYGYRDAIYTRGSGTSTLTFTYQVQLGDVDHNGITISTRSATGQSTSAKILAARPDKNVDAIQLFERRPNIAGQKVDGRDYVEFVRITSNPREGDTYGAGEVITVALEFSDKVAIQRTGHRIRLRLGPETEDDSSLREARYDSGTYTDTLVFRYKVQEGDEDIDGISVVPGSEEYQFGPGEQFITTSGASPNVDPNYPGLDDAAGHKVDAPDVTSPTVSSIAITSDPGDDDTYGEGDSIEVTVTFTENVTVTGAPQLELDFDGTAKTAEYKSVSGKAVVFSYTVTGGDTDTDGIAIGENKLTLNGGTIQDAAENDAVLAHTAMTADAGHKVSAPGGL